MVKKHFKLTVLALILSASMFVGGCANTNTSTNITETTEVTTEVASEINSEATEESVEVISNNVVSNTETVESTEPEVVVETSNKRVEKVTEKITYDTVIEYTDEVILYDFKKSGNVGSTRLPNDIINYEGFSGTRMSIDGNTLTYSFYKHSSNTEPNAVIKIYKMRDKNTVYSEINAKKDVEYTFDISDLENGLYYLYTVAKSPDGEIPIYHYFYVNGNDSYMCSVYYGDNLQIKKGRENFVNAMKNIDPNDCLDLSEMTYPTSGQGDRVVHVDLWIEKSKELVKDGWTDEAKVFSFVDYISNNIAYDAYKVDVLKYSRARTVSTDTYDGYTDDNNFAYYNGVGVCWDYTNILAIMCRYNGIPCTSYDETGHTYNAVYLNGHWMPIDITLFNKYECNSLDTSDITKRSKSKRELTNGYGTYKGCYVPLSIGKQIWTYENATNPDNNAAWVRELNKNK